MKEEKKTILKEGGLRTRNAALNLVRDSAALLVLVPLSAVLTIMAKDKTKDVIESSKQLFRAAANTVGAATEKD